MHPFLELFGLTIPVYGLLSFVGVLAAGAVAVLIAKRRGVDVYDLLLTALVAGVGLFIGAQLLYALTRIEDIASAFANYGSFASFGEFAGYVLDIAGGMVFYGGLYGGLLFGFLWARRMRYPLKNMGDVFAVAIQLFHAFGRVGCYFAGCCFGMEWEYGISGRVLASGAVEGVKRLPIQLIEACALLVLFGVLLVLFFKEKAHGRLICVYLISYAVLRFTLEFFRGDAIRGHFLMLSTSQWISLLTLIGVGLYIFLSRRKAKKE